MKELITLLVSLCIAELIHNAIEVWGMRQKVSWLDKSLKGEQHGKWPVNIDTKVKTIILHMLLLVSVTGLSCVILGVLSFSTKSLVLLGIIILLINYGITTEKVDSFHTEIGKLIKQAKDK